MKRVCLTDAAHLILGQSPPSTTYNSTGVGLPFFQGKTDFGEIFPTERVYCSQPNRIAETGDILLSVRAPVGPTNLNRVTSCIGRGLAALRPKDGTDRDYLLYFLRFYEPTLAALGQGSTFEAISKSDLEEVQIPLPPLAEQQRIAGLLRRADRLRRLRRYALDVSAGYLQAVFVEMFFNQARPDWPIVTVAELAKAGKNTVRTGPFGSQLLHSEFVDEGIPVLGIDNIVQNRFVWAKSRFITQEKYRQLQRYTVFPDDVLITIMGTVGRCAVAPPDIPVSINTKHLCCITLDREKCLPTFLKWCFLVHPDIRRQLGIAGRGAIMPGLNMEIIKDLHFPLPPMALQQRLKGIADQSERLWSQQSEALRQAEHLFQALLRRAFQTDLPIGCP